MRISARNQIKGTVIDVKKGATTSHIRVDIGNGQTVTSSITNEAVDELGIKAKDKVTGVVKASDVMIAVD
jgi:molybdopterin-binding protein